MSRPQGRLSIARFGASVEVWAFADNRTIGRCVEHLAVQHSAVFECEMQSVAVLGPRAMGELHHAGLPAHADLDLIRNGAEIARSAFDLAGSAQSFAFHTQ